MSTNKIADGQNILYHYFQRDLENDKAITKKIITRLITDLSIWLPTSLYKKLPVILPYVVRDNNCRGKNGTKEEEWGSANTKGFLRDDNSLLKGLVRSFKISSPTFEGYENKKIGNGFVASHIWGKISYDGSSIISSRHHMLNSFIPNVVWLPVQLSKLSDRDGSYAQRLLQAMSYEIYGKVALPRDLRAIWTLLQYPKEMDNIKIRTTSLNFFQIPDKWIRKRILSLIKEIEIITSIDKQNYNTKVKSSRYLPTLKKTVPEKRADLIQWLTLYKDWLSQELLFEY